MALHFALTGGIGSGKSTVARLLVECGAVLVDTDAIAHQLTTPGGAAMPALQREFGPEIVAADGAMDRSRMRERVFADATAKRRLEGILHPMIGAEAQRQADAAGAQPVFFDVPLLTPGSPWRQRVRRILVVDCAENTQVQRVMQRSGWSEEQVRRVIAQQTSRSARRALSDAVIHNDGLDMLALRDEVRTLWARWCVEPQGTAAAV